MAALPCTYCGTKIHGKAATVYFHQGAGPLHRSTVGKLCFSCVTEELTPLRRYDKEHPSLETCASCGDWAGDPDTHHVTIYAYYPSLEVIVWTSAFCDDCAPGRIEHLLKLGKPQPNRNLDGRGLGPQPPTNDWSQA